ncbi:VOC family protein, partial [Vibrio anguillarum]|nr:VOC family protein [Vibrio anguillarum]MBF4364598.1 VOC family protein [Vibrio anguillarum]
MPQSKSRFCSTKGTSMFSHIMIGSNDIEKSKVFYDAILSVLGYPSGVIDAKGRCLYINKDGVLGITKPINGELATHGNGMTIGLKVTHRLDL